MNNEADVKKDVHEVAERIACLRDAAGFTSEQMAEELGVPLETYLSYENDGSDIPISAIYEIAHKFNMDFSEILTGSAAKLDTYHIVRNGKGRDVNRYPGYAYQDLAFRYSRKIMQPLLVTLDPTDKPASLVSHPGQEFNMVLEGSIAVVFSDKEFILEEGDSIYFNPLLKHGQKCVGDKTAKFLTMIAE